jgi:hypothetical protein
MDHCFCFDRDAVRRGVAFPSCLIGTSCVAGNRDQPGDKMGVDAAKSRLYRWARFFGYVFSVLATAAKS